MNKTMCFIRQCRILLGNRLNTEPNKTLQNMGWTKGLEPSTTGITIRCFQFCYQKLALVSPNKAAFQAFFIISYLHSKARRILGTFFTISSAGVNA